MNTTTDYTYSYTTGTVTSTDGTTIGYRQLGTGPALILIHGSMQAAQHLMRLARTLADDFTVYLPDRRGRGLSGPHGKYFGIDREVEDIQVLVAATGSTKCFGLSSGALLTLHTASTTPNLNKIALYEPALSVGDAFPLHWAERFDREIAANKSTSALVTVFKGLRVEPLFNCFPRFALVPRTNRIMRAQRDLPALDALEEVLPHVRRPTFDGLDHSAPEDRGAPERVAQTLCEYFV
ncbi:MAG TPA: alpha/beta hydrolase [Actinocrinis sp.]|nr:alpha/beta hydrolase [Actinocrinis sp.]